MLLLYMEWDDESVRRMCSSALLKKYSMISLHTSVQTYREWLEKKMYNFTQLHLVVCPACLV